MTATPTALRIVPGAPQPIELSKSQKKKRKAAKADDALTPVTADAEKAHEHVVSSESAHPPGLVSRAESQAPNLLEEDPKPSPIADLMNRRLKAMTKKIARISTYAATDIEKLNDDQVRSLKNLPTLEAIQKELVEVKKAIETQELEHAQELTAKRLEAEKAEKARISNAVSDAEASLFTRFDDVLCLLRLHSLLTSGSLDLSSLADSSEISALFSISNILLGEHDQRQSVVEQLVRGVGEFEGTQYARLFAITHHALRLPSPLPPTPEESIDEEQSAEPPSINGAEEEEEAEEAEEEQQPVTGIPNVASMSGSFQFIQQSELEAASFEGASEWVDATVPEPAATGVRDDAEHVPAISEAPEHGNGTLDWAADEEGGLPSIAGLQAKFGNSGSATPAEATPPEAAPAETTWQTYGEATNGEATTPARADDDGFTQAKGRARGRGGFRGERGERGFRGGRGGDRGSHRGGDRGFRGGRGGDRFRGGRGGSEWRGDGDRARDSDGDRGFDGEGDREGDRQREGGRGRGGFGRGRGGEGGRGRGEGRGRGRGGEGRGRGGGERRGRGDRGGHHHEASPASTRD